MYFPYLMDWFWTLELSCFLIGPVKKFRSHISLVTVYFVRF